MIWVIFIIINYCSLKAKYMTIHNFSQKGRGKRYKRNKEGRGGGGAGCD